MMKWRFAALTALALGLGVPTAALAQTTGSPAVNSDELVVTGQRVDEAIRSFVEQLSAAPSSEDQLARWDRRICPGVAGMRSHQAQLLIDRLAQRAFQVGLDVGETGCRPNVLIFVTPDSDVLARQIVDGYPDLIGYHTDQTTQTRGHEALEAFASTPRAVRWWHVSQTVTRDGQVLGNTQARMSPRGGLREVQMVHQAPANMLQRATRQDFNRVLIIIDARRAAGLSFDALGDYVAMAALAQLDPDANVSNQSTILNLFSSREAGATPPAGMTDWDLAYLHGLYDAQRNAVNSRRQEGDISRRMRRDIPH